MAMARSCSASSMVFFCSTCAFESAGPFECFHFQHHGRPRSVLVRPRVQPQFGLPLLRVFASFLSGNFSQLFSTSNGNFTFLLQLGIFFFTNNLQTSLFSFQILGLNCQICILFNMVTLATTILNSFSKLGQAFCIESILWIEIFKSGLIQTSQ